MAPFRKGLAFWEVSEYQEEPDKGGWGGVQIGQIPLEGLPGEGFQAWKEVPGKTPDGSGDSPGRRKLKLLCLEDCPHELPLERS